ncbi:MAG TPA: hypothetical protein VJ814_08830 [Gaiellaceae bacterium]|nr:hypothetical protein [Gaiellaceae bacterium]
MRARVAFLVAGVVLIGVAAASGAPARTAKGLPRSALVPNAVAFLDRRQGLLGTGWEGCANQARRCRLQGTVSVTSDGGATWHVVLRTPRPVVAVEYFHDATYAQTDDGRTYTGDSAGRGWQRRSPLSFKGYCPKGWHAGVTADFVDTNIDTPWSICTGEPGAGNVAKAVYLGTRRVAFTPLGSRGGYGGIGVYGYPVGISGTHGGFGLIWETRGTLYLTHDGGRHWHALPHVARPEIDFGDWADADAYPHGTAFVLLSAGGGETRRLIGTTDAGRTWRVVHRWR